MNWSLEHLLGSRTILDPHTGHAFATDHDSEPAVYDTYVYECTSGVALVRSFAIDLVFVRLVLDVKKNHHLEFCDVIVRLGKR